MHKIKSKKREKEKIIASVLYVIKAEIKSKYIFEFELHLLLHHLFLLVLFFLFVLELIIFGCRILILLIFGDQIIHIAFSFSELHLIHSFAGIPMHESLSSKHSRE
eukprot:1050579_1